MELDDDNRGSHAPPPVFAGVTLYRVIEGRMTQDFYIPNTLLQEKAVNFTEIFLPPVHETVDARIVNITTIAVFNLFVDWLQMDAGTSRPTLSIQDDTRLAIDAYIFGKTYEIERFHQAALRSLSTSIKRHRNREAFIEHTMEEIKFVYSLSFPHVPLRNVLVDTFYRFELTDDYKPKYNLSYYPRTSHLPHDFANGVRCKRRATRKAEAKKRLGDHRGDKQNGWILKARIE